MEIDEEAIEIPQAAAAAEWADPEEDATNDVAGNYMAKRFMITAWEHKAPEGWTPALWIAANRALLDYAVWQKKRTPTTGKLHWHLYVRYVARKRARTVLASFPHGIWLGKCRGNETECRTYCTKEETRESPGEEYGTYKPDEGKQGKRTDLEAIAAKCTAGTPLEEIASAHPADFIRYHGGIRQLHILLAPPQPIERPVTVIVLWGPTGTGKTHRIRHAFPDLHLVKPGRDPWGGYRRQAAVCFDEFDYEKWTIQQMNDYCDKWSIELDSRYNNKMAVYTTIIIIANSSPMQWWPNERGTLLISAFHRRITDRCWFVPNQQGSLSDLMATPPTMPHTLATLTFGEHRPASPTQPL